MISLWHSHFGELLGDFFITVPFESSVNSTQRSSVVTRAMHAEPRARVLMNLPLRLAAVGCTFQ